MPPFTRFLFVRTEHLSLWTYSGSLATAAPRRRQMFLIATSMMSERNLHGSTRTKLLSGYVQNVKRADTGMLVGVGTSLSDGQKQTGTTIQAYIAPILNGY